MRKPNNHFIRKEDLIYTPQVGISDGFAGGLSALEGDRRLATQMFEVANAIQQSEDNLRRSITEQQNKVLLLDAKNKLSAINQGLYEQLKYDPEKFKVSTNEAASKVINELPLLLRDEVKGDFLQEQNSYYYKAFGNKRDYLDKQKFQQLQVYNKNLAKSAINAIQEMVSKQEDILQANGQIELGYVIGRFEESLGETNSYGIPLFYAKNAEKERQGFYGTLFDQFASLKLGTFKNISDAENFINEVENGSSIISYQRLGATFDIPSSLLDEKKRHSIASHLRKNLHDEIKRRQDQEDKEFLQQVENKEITPDYKDSHYRDIVNKRYEDDVRPLFNIDDPVQTTSLLVNFIDAHQTIPQGLVSDLRSGMYSNNPNLLAICSDVINDVRVNQKHLLSLLPKKDFAKADMMSSLLKTNKSIVEAFETVNQMYEKTSPAIIEQRTQEFEEGKKPIDTELAKLYPKVKRPGWLFGPRDDELKKTPALTLAIWRDEIKRYAKTYFLQGSDMDKSIELAESAVNTRWGESNVNGNTVWTLLPAEKYYYEYNSKGETLREVLLGWVKKQKFGNVPQDIPLDSFFIIADAKTEQEAGNITNKPTYALMFKDGYDREINVVDENGQFIRVGEDVFVEQKQNKTEQFN